MIYSENLLKKIVNKKNIQNFNDLGGLSMYEYKIFSGEKITPEKEAVLNKLKEIDKKYSIEEFVPNEITSLGLEKKEFITPSQDEIKKEAEQSLKPEKDNELKSIENSYEKKFSDIDNKLLDLNDDNNENINDLFNNYKNSLNNVTNSSIKQGISRSSIFDQAVDIIENNKNNNLEKLNYEFEKEKNKLEKEIEILQKQKDNALESFDISYALKLEDKINNINKEISKQIEEVNKYNADIEKQEQEHREMQEKANLEEQKRVEEHNKEITDLKEELGEGQFYNNMLKERYDVILDYLMSIPKEQALNLLEKDNSYQVLLSTYYPAIYAQMLNRNS